jgi:hypothetical protein
MVLAHALVGPPDGRHLGGFLPTVLAALRGLVAIRGERS